MKKLLVIGKTFPEPNTTAAGGRMMNLLGFFKNLSYKITFVSTAAPSPNSADLKVLGIDQQNIEVNDASFDQFVAKLSPLIVMYDRFITEEQFGWRVRAAVPDALTILDTEDLHFLRKAREQAVKQQVDFTEDMLFTEEAKRELASIWRCDLSLIISTVEMDILHTTFHVPSEKLFYLPLTVSNLQLAEVLATPPIPRTDFITAGNFYHAPNVDAVTYLKKEIWPLIRKELPEAKLNVYGAYSPQKIKEMHKPSEGFYIYGWTHDLNAAYREAKVCLAPLRFGAGLKGKLLQAMLTLTPMVTTSIGAEGMYGDFKVPGKVADTPQAIADAAISLYKGPNSLDNQDVTDLLKDRFLEDNYYPKLSRCIEALEANLTKHRNANFFGEILQYKTLTSTKYLSKWIEEKNRA